MKILLNFLIATAVLVMVITCTHHSHPIQLVKSSEQRVYRHHVEFDNVCWVKQADGHSRLQLINVPTAVQRRFDREYWSKNDPFWRLYREYVDFSPTSSETVHLKGTTFFYTLHVDNIAQFFQELACHEPILLNRQYRAGRNHTWDNFFTPHLQIGQPRKATGEDAWCHQQLKWTVEAAEVLQPGHPIHLTGQHNLSTHPRVCFDRVIVYQPGSCKWHDEPLINAFPAGTREANRLRSGHILRSHGLREKVGQCLKSIIVYDRGDAGRRRLINGQHVVDTLEKMTNVSVRLLSSLPQDIHGQMEVYNSADLFIEPHSASNYNTQFQPAGALHYEIGQHAISSWWERGMAPWSDQVYKAWKFGWQVVDDNDTTLPANDVNRLIGERDFAASDDLIRGLGSPHDPLPFCTAF